MADNKIRSGYEEVDRIIDPDGIIGIVSSRLGGHPKFTIGIFKTFTRDGDPDNKTSFFNVEQAEAAIRVIRLAKESAERHQATASKVIADREEKRVSRR